MNRTLAVIWVSLSLLATAGITYLLYEQFTFHTPEFFWYLLILPLLALVYILRLNKSYAQVKQSSITAKDRQRVPFKAWFRHLLFGLKLIGLGLLILGLARPQAGRSPEDEREEGIDIIIALDVSGSMHDTDISPSRIEAAKRVGMEFIQGRKDDRIGLVLFEGESFTQAPLTSDHEIVLMLFDEVHAEMLSERGTAIGDGLATSVSRLRDSKSDSKVVILLSDGENTSGSILPEDAIKMAQDFDVKVYTIAIGSNGYSRGGFFGSLRRSGVSEGTLKTIAEETGGKFFKATSKRKMENIYADIDEMERTIIDRKNYNLKDERFFLISLIGLGLVLLYHVFYDLIFRVIQ